jgi:RND family efflux transporter MFP subunit
MLVAGLAFPATIAVVACNSGTRSSKADAAENASAQVAVVQRGNIDQVLSLAGQFQPYQTVDVHPKVSGFIRHIYVDIGDRVRQGQTLAVLEVPELKAQLSGTVSEVARSGDEIVRAQHEVQRAESTHSAIHADYDRLLQTSQAQPGLVAQQELDDAQEVSKADNQRVSAIEDYTNVVAPLDGVIIWRYADTGALIQSGVGSNNQDLPIVKLAQSGVMRLRLPVPETYVRYVHIGDTVQLRVDSLGRYFTGTVVRFTRELNFETRTMETEIDVPNKDLTIDSGMYANALLRLNHADNVVTIQLGALVLRGNQQQVYVLDGGNHVHIRTVQTGIRGNQLVEIRSGLSPGDRVIVAAQSKYTENEVVTPVVEKTPASETAPQSGGMIDMNAENSANESQQ